MRPIHRYSARGWGPAKPGEELFRWSGWAPGWTGAWQTEEAFLESLPRHAESAEPGALVESTVAP